LDPNKIIEIRDLIKKLSKKKMVLLSTHILPEAKAVCDKLLVINRGRIVLDEKTNKIRSLEKRFVELTV
jgi:ABC-2 type transport system ATP-binding protein